MDLGRKAASLVTVHFPKPISLEFEKCYFPYLLINKKRYAGLLWTNPSKYDKMDTKGIETVRRDNCPLVQSLIDRCLRKILIERDVEGAKRHLLACLFLVLQKGQYPISCKTRSTCPSWSSQRRLASPVWPPLISRRRLQCQAGPRGIGYADEEEGCRFSRYRFVGSAPSLGDRVPYVIVKSTKGTASFHAKARLHTKRRKTPFLSSITTSPSTHNTTSRTSSQSH